MHAKQLRPCPLFPVLTTLRAAVVLLVFALSVATPARSEEATRSIDLGQLLRLITGDFDNRKQYEAQEGDTFSHLGLQRRLVHAPALGDHVVYAQINRRADPSDVYRQSIMRFEQHEDGSVSARNLRFASPDEHREIMRDLKRFESLDEEDVVAALPDGCDPVWTREGERFVSRISASECVMISRRDGKPRRIQATEFVGVHAIENEESGYNEDGSKIFGLPEATYYRYERISPAPE
ncbi:MAG: hypothetical protein Cons2KO_13360 [Congregibacter sp.]